MDLFAVLAFSAVNIVALAFCARQRCLLLLLIAGVGAGSAFADTPAPVMSLVPVIRSFAGGGSGGDNVAATSSLMAAPAGTAIDSSGNVYIADATRHTVRLVSASTGLITTVVGGSGPGYSGDGGQATSAKINGPEGIALDPFGNLFVADTGNNVIRKIVLGTGIITTYAGTGIAGYSGDNGSATLAKLNQPRSVASDRSGRIFFSDANNHRIRVISSSGVITTVVGTGTAGFSGDGGAAVTAQLNNPLGVQVDASGNLFVADYGNNRIRKVAAGTQSITTIAGTGTAGFSGDGDLATRATLRNPIEAFPDAQGNLYITDNGNNRIRKVAASSGIITTYAGTGSAGYSGDGGPATSAALNFPVSIIQDSFGTLYIADYGNGRVRTISALTGSILFPQTDVGSTGTTQNIVLQTSTAASISSIAARTSSGGKKEFVVGKVSGCVVNGSTSNPAGTICTVAVSFTPGYAGPRLVPLQVSTSTGTVAFGLAGAGGGPQVALSPGTLHQVPLGQSSLGLSGIVVDNAGNVYIAATASNEVLCVNGSSHAVTVYAGNGTAAWSGDSSAATSASLNAPTGLALDAAGNLYIADSGNLRVRRVESGTGIITTVAGNGQHTSAGDGGPALSAGLLRPSAVALDTAGNLYIAEADGNRVRRVVAGSTIISTYAGTGSGGFAGDGGVAAAAQLNAPQALALDAAGNLYISDAGNNRIRMVSSASLYISTVAGGGSSGSDGVMATSAVLLAPAGIAVDGAANLYIAEANGNRLRIVSSANGFIQTLAGNGQAGPGANSVAATSTPVEQPAAVAMDALGNPWIVNDLGLAYVDGSAAPLLSFASTPVGTTSTDSPRVITLENTGNRALAFPVPSSGANPAVSASFSVDGSIGNACPQRVAGQVGSGSLAAGSSCLLAVTFTPATTGTLQGNVVLSDTALNATNALQTLTMVGTATADSVQMTLSAPASITYGNALQVTATVTNDASQSPVSSGAVVFSDQVGSFGSQSVLQGTAVRSYLPAGIGTFTLSGAFTPAASTMNKASAQTSIQVTGAPLNVVANSATRVYGAANPVFTGSIAGAVNGDSFQEAFQTSATAASPVSTYSIVPSASGANLGNYLQNFTKGTLQVTAAALTVQANNATRTYGAANPAFTGSLSGALNGDQLTEIFSTAATAGSPVATYAIIPSVTGASASNYNPTVKNGTLTIMQAGVTVVASNATRTYGAANPQFTGSINGLVNGDVLTETFTTSATQASPVASYAIVPALSGASLGNYKPSITNGTLTISPAALSLKANDSARTYGAANPAFAGSVTGAVNGDSFTGTYTTSATAASPLGTYAIVPSASGLNLANYTQNATNGTLTISPASLTLKADDVTRPYGAANPAFTGGIDGAVNADAFTLSFSTAANEGSAPGSYPIVPKAAGTNLTNYTQVTREGTLTITPAAITLTASDATRAYGAPNPTLTGSMTGVVAGDRVEESFSTDAGLSSPVGSYVITPSASGPGLVNYAQTMHNGVLTITPAMLHLTADNAVRVYGTANPVFTGAITGAADGAPVTEHFSTAATVASRPGTYPIAPSLETSTPGNYTVTTSDGVLTITAAPLTITAADASRMYGEANPVFTGSMTGVIAGDTFEESYTTAATAQSAVGIYPVLPGIAGTTLEAYTLTKNSGRLTILPAPLHVAVASVTRPFGAANPTFTGTVRGTVNSDALAVTYTTAAGPTDQPGQYPITATVTGNAVGNYAVQVDAGVLTIEKAPSATALITPASASTDNGALLLSAQVSGPLGTAPAGTVRFFDGNSLLGEATLQGTTAVFSTATLQPGTRHTIVAVYGGDMCLLTSSSKALVVSPGATSSFWIKPDQGTNSITLQAGTAGKYVLRVGPGDSGMYPDTVVFAVTGLPKGTTGTFSPSVLAADQGEQIVTLAIATAGASATAALLPDRMRWASGLGSALLALVLLPCTTARKLRRVHSRIACTLFFAIAAVAGSSVLVGCGFSPGTGWGQEKKPETSTAYALTITMRSGGIEHTIPATLTIEQ